MTAQPEQRVQRAVLEDPLGYAERGTGGEQIRENTDRRQQRRQQCD
jgi:hypothetical protein